MKSQHLFIQHYTLFLLLGITSLPFLSIAKIIGLN